MLTSSFLRDCWPSKTENYIFLAKIGQLVNYILQRLSGDRFFYHDFLGVPAVGGFQPEAVYIWGMCQLEDLNLSDFQGTIRIVIHFYLINATIEHYSFRKIYV